MKLIEYQSFKGIEFLSYEKECSLVIIVQDKNSDKSTREEALETLLLSHIRYIASCAKDTCKKYNSIYLYDDVLSEGVKVFVKDIQNPNVYNPNLGFKVMTKLGSRIKAYMERFTRSMIRSVHIPEHIQGKLIKYNVLNNKFLLENNKNEDIDELASLLGLKIHELRNLLSILSGDISLNEINKITEKENQEYLIFYNDELQRQFKLQKLREEIKEILNDNENKIWELKVIGFTSEAIALEMGIEKHQVDYLFSKIKTKLFNCKKELLKLVY